MLHDELGSLAKYFDSPSITEVMINNETSVFVEDECTMRYMGELHPGEIHAIVERILLPLGKRLDRVSPIVDARLHDGSRMCAIIPPIAPHGMCVSFRRFNSMSLTLDHFSMPPVVELLKTAVHQRLNIMISGKAGSGKTSFLNALCKHIEPSERVISIEDVRELVIEVHNSVHLETRSSTPEGVAGVSMTELVRASLRMRPDRFVVGEIRGAETVDMLSALNTGHSGSMSSCHSHSAMHAVQRIESLMLQHCPQWGRDTIREHVYSAIDIIVHLHREEMGNRFVSEIVELPLAIHETPKQLYCGANVTAFTRSRKVGS